MISDYKYEKLVKPIIDIYNEIEQELIMNIVKQLKTTPDDVNKWYFKKLREIGGLNKENLKTISKRSKKSQKYIKEAITTAGIDGIDYNIYKKAYSKNQIKKNPNILFDNEKINNTINKAIEETTNITKLINSKAISNSQEQYKKILNQAYLETSSGIYDYKQSISRALYKMGEEGITAVQYKRKDGSIINYSIEGVVRRDILTKTRQTALATQMDAIKLMKINLVSVPAHLGARVDLTNKINNHQGWQGKIYMLEGTSRKYHNFYKSTGYGELLGLGGVNCRHWFEPYIEGISLPPEKVRNKKNEFVYQLTQRQRQFERDVRKAKRNLEIAKELQDEEGIIKYKKQVQIKTKRLRDYVNSHEELKRDYLREKIAK